MVVAFVSIFPAARIVSAGAFPGHGSVANIANRSTRNWTFDSSI